MPSCSFFGVTQMIIMKAVFTLFFVLILGAVALAQNTQANVEVDTIEMDIILVTSINHTNIAEKVEITTENKVARLYKFKNSRIKKALAFRTKSDRAKMA